MRLVLPLERLRVVRHDAKSSLGGSGSRLRIEGVNTHLTRHTSGLELLRVAASSNRFIERTSAGVSTFAAHVER